MKEMLRAFVPALEAYPQTTLLVDEMVLPKWKEGNVLEERRARRMDMCMLNNFGGKERSRAEWQKLLKEVDERLEIIKVMEQKETLCGCLGLLVIKLVK